MLRRAAWLLSLSLLVTPSATSAGTLHLSWDGCWGDAAVTNKSFACNANSGSETLVCSYVPAADIPGVTGIYGHLLLVSQSPLLPTWWSVVNPSSCRPSSVAMSGTYTGDGHGCTTHWPADSTVTGIARYGPVFVPPGSATNTSDLEFGAAVPLSRAFTMPANGECFFARFTIDHANTTGAAPCTGCLTPVCFVFQNAQVFSTGGDFAETNPYVSNSTGMVTWQGDGANCAQVPVRNRTWGAIKSLYR